MPNSTDFVQFNIQYASIALVYHDYALTFGWEIKYIWGERFRPSTLFYICTRYSLFANILFLVSIIDKTSPQLRCRIQDLLYFQCIRPGFSNCGLDCKNICNLQQEQNCPSLFLERRPNMHSPRYCACTFGRVPRELERVMSTALAGLMCLFEISVALCTSVRTIQALLLNDRALTPKGGMVYLLLEQGIAYFITVTCFTVAAFILSLRAPGGFFQRLLNALTLPISCLMTARFLLHLRRWEHKHTTSNDDTIESIRFNQNVPGSRSLLSDFGEDPVRRAEVDIQARRHALGKACAVDSDDLPDNDNHGEGSSMV
ncbi:hypothetical protein BDZ94DRAFT_264615 [Collybia nuda]|uniref:DUF6533 domain-containing protein n=1 Tax=Collybia nuda TaxID=64659 RepID=A0A9P6C9B2_9AGAR|nr:hypothetical protein BDZ94DRAFT_264615 [Collybia nuda]